MKGKNSYQTQSGCQPWR